MSIQYQPLSGSLLDDHNFPEMMRKIESHIGVVYDDGKHIATIGIGTNIKEVKAYLALALKELGVFQPVAGETDAQRNARYGAIIQGFQNVIASHPLDRRGNQSPGMSDSEIALQNALNAELNKYLPGQRFELSEIQSKNIVRQITLGFEIAADTNPADGAANGAFLKTTGIVIALDQRLATDGYGVVLNHNTREYQALLSLQFNTKAGATNLIGNNLRQALKDGSRAEAWYEIRYNSNGDVLDGIAKRRYYEAEIFGLYDSPGSTTDTEAKSVLQMYTRHRTAIIKYEATYSLQIAAAKSDYGLSGSGEVDTLAQALSLARTRLIATEVTGRGITSVIDGEVLIGQDSDFTSRVKVVPKTWYNNDILTGTDKNDLILGGEGADRLEGGKGEDVLVGGNGLDVYVVDGNDRIVDSDGQGIVVDKNGNIVAGVFEKAAGSSTYTWKGDGSVTATKNSPLTLYLPDGSTVIIEDHANNGDFGITLLDTPPAPATLLSGDVLANYLEAAAGGQRVEGLAGADMIMGSGASGTDHLLGGDGADWIVANGGADLIEGGLGNDYMSGMSGNSQAYGGDGNDLITAALAEGIQLSNIGNIPGLTADILWADAQSGFGLSAGLTYDGAGNLDLLHGSVPLAPYGGASALGGGWSFSMAFGGGTWSITYTHPTLAPGGKIPTGTWEHFIVPVGLTEGVFLFGEAGDDLIVGNDGADYLDGGSGQDQLFGHAGNDVLDGGSENDILAGGDGQDILLGGDRNDELYGEQQDDVLIGGSGNDVMWGDSPNALLAAWDGNDYLDGGDGDDELGGGGGDDILIGGQGVDYLAGGAGDDTYLNVTGLDTVDDTEGNNILRFDQSAGLAAGNALSVTDGGATLLVTLDNGETITLQNAPFGMNASLQFSNGDSLDLETLVGTTLATPLYLALDDSGGRLYGGAGADALYGGAGDDNLAGHLGNDTLQGGWGNDVYSFAVGDGVDTIIETGGSADVLRFAADITPQQVGFSPDNGGTGNLYLILSDANGNPTGEGIHLKSYFSADEAERVDRIEFADGTVWTFADIQSRLHSATDGGDLIKGYAGVDVIDGLEGNDSVNGKAGNDTLQGGAGDDDLQGGLGNDTLTGGAGNDRLLGYGAWADDSLAANEDPGNDVLYGGAGNDRMFGGQGDDIYLFGRGDGFDEIGETQNASGSSMDVLRLGAGVLPEHVTLHRVQDGWGSDDLIVVIDGSSTQILISSYFSDTSDSRVERIEFDDGAGPVWTAVDIDAHVQAGTYNSMAGTSADDVFVVDHHGDSVTEAADSGTDTVLASRRFTLPGNVENLTLTGFLNINGTGNELNNILTGNAGINSLTGGDGFDIAIGGPGDDTYFSVEEIIEYAGEGIDTWFKPNGGTLPDNVENLYMGTYGPKWTPLGSGSSYTYYPGTAIGNDLDNVLVSPGNGTSGNVLDGRGGADTMVVNGSDKVTVYVDNPGDKIISVSKPPYEIRSTIDYALAEPRRYAWDNQYIADSVTNRLVLLGSNPINGLGNPVNNVLISHENTASNTLIGGGGDDTYVIGLNDHAVEVAGEGDDKVYLYLDASDSGREIWLAELGMHHIERYELAGNANNVSLHGDASENELRADQGSYGNYGTKLFGGDGNDLLRGGAEGDVLDGEVGADVMQGGAGNDLYIVDDAGDQVLESQTTYYNSFDGWEDQPYYSWVGKSSGFDTVHSGVTYTLGSNVEDLLLTGTAAINGTGNELSNVLTGNSANNMLSGDKGNDTIDGGAGDDMLVGGEGNDVYIFGKGSGRDTVNSFDPTAGKIDAVQFGTGVASPDVQVSLSGNDLVLTINGTADTLTVLGYMDPGGASAVEQFWFSDGVTWDMAAVKLMLGGNQAPMLSTAIPDLTAAQGGVFSYTVAADAFTDPDADDTLTYSAALADGSALPSWLSFNAETRTFSGTPSNLGTISVRVTAKDTGDLTVSDVFGIAVSVQNLTLNGTAGADTLVGYAGNDTLYGGAGNDSLIGGQGIDTLVGGLGDDTYSVDNVADIVAESAGEGTDTVQTTISRTLDANVENLTLMGNVAIDGTGNELNNVLAGNGMANALDGGLGADTLVGGLGNDTYVVDNVGDVVTETSTLATEIDVVLSSVTYTLGANIENLTLTGSAVIDGSGNALANVLRGNSAANALSALDGDDTIYAGDSDTALGGNGNDTLISEGTTSWTYLYGEAGDDVLTGGSTSGLLIGGVGNDTITGGAWYNFIWGDDLAGGAVGGNDTIIGGNDYDYVMAGAGDDVVYGNGGDDSLAGNQGNDTLYGGAGNDSLIGGQGIDTLVGGLGDDTYSVDNVADIVTESAGEGTDTVQTTISRTLDANVENLTLTGTAAINGAGNELANVLAGNSANNVLTGGAGNDTYIFGKGSGQDSVNSYDTTVGKIDTVQFDATVAPSEVQVSRLGNDLVLAINGTTDTLTIQQYMDNDGASAYTVEQIKFQDGTIWDVATVKAKLTVNQSPLLSYALPDQVSAQGGVFSYTVAADAFTDPDAGDTLTYSATLADGSALPSWLSFNAETRTFSGTPGNLGTTSVRVTAKDTGDLTVSDNFDITVSVQNLTLYGTIGADTLVGYAGNDLLDGGLGADTMTGGVGNDIYVVDNLGDVVSETSVLATEIDTVKSTVNYTLGANLENLTLAGSAAINGTGNTLNNVLTGNSGANVLNGAAGADTLIGGAGNDIYVVDNIWDIVTESLDEGTDLIQASISYTFETDLTYTRGAANVENLLLTGTADINGTGNELDNGLTGNGAVNTLTGGAGNDRLDGMGGNDSLTGGTGNDTYLLGLGYGLDTVVENDATAGNIDVAQFLSGAVADQIWFQHVGNNLEASIIGTGDKLVVKDWYLGTANHVEQFRTTDGAKTLFDGNVQNLVNAMASFAPPAAGQTTLPQRYQDALAGVIAANWQ